MRIAKFHRFRPYFVAVMVTAADFIFTPAHAAPDQLNTNLTKGTTTQVTPSKKTRRKTSTIKKVTKTPAKVLIPANFVPEQKGDTRDRWDKNKGPLVPHKTFSKKCDICHIPKRWDVLRPDFHFDHLKETKYALEGAHAKIACLLCHNDRAAPKGLVLRSCSGCHEDVHKGTLGLDCKKCHSEINWKPIETALGQHARTRFPLTGIHATVLCIQCHPRADAKDFSAAPVDCYSCHTADYQKAPNHVAMNFSHACNDCHTTTTFTGALFDHSTLGPNPNCYQCHQADYQSANNPPHAGILPTTCGACHVTTTWLLSSGGTFDHSLTGFALTGAHATATCAECHVNNNYAIPNANCVPCHNTDFGTGSFPGATTPVAHGAAPFLAASCQTCHGDFQLWANAANNFNHSLTGFALSAKHATAACATCHDVTPYTNNGGQISSTNCVPCHNTDFGTGSFVTASAPTATPVVHGVTPYVASACSSCHGDFNNWLSATAFDHSTLGPGFPWTGTAHAAAACASCHSRSGVTLSGNTLTVTCTSCHQTDYNGAATPVAHTAALFPAASCQTCHGDATLWANAANNFNHTITGFTLSGKHVTTCATCHDVTPYTNNGGKISGTNCVPCHQADYTLASSAAGPAACPTGGIVHNPSTNPTTSCSTCHGDFNNWCSGTGGFDHSTLGPTFYKGAHITAITSGQCASCHSIPGVTLSGTSLTVTCLSCHQSNNTGNGSYNSTSPSHASMGWPLDATSCAQCHGDLANWASGAVNAAPLHGTTFGAPFTLIGAHNDSGKTNGGGVVASCVGCHANSQSFISGTSCIPCHQQDYANASLPSATPVVHDPTGYPSANCAGCHGDFTSWLNGVSFNHASVGFALTGMHNTACANCHNATLGQTHTGHACAMCHLSYDTGGGDYNNAATPINHTATGGGRFALPTTCDNCHTYQAVWASSLITPHPTGSCGDQTGTATPWNHQGAHNCSDCHNTVTSMTVADGTFECANCHNGHHAGTLPGVCGR